MSFSKSSGINPKPYKWKTAMMAMKARIQLALNWDLPHTDFYQMESTHLTLFEFIQHPNIKPFVDNVKFMVFVRGYIKKQNLYRLSDYTWIQAFEQCNNLLVCVYS